MYASRPSAACWGVTVDSMTAAVRPLSPSALPLLAPVPHPLFPSCRRQRCSWEDSTRASWLQGHTDTGAPLIHRGHPFARLMHNRAPPGLVEQFQLAIGDEAVDLNDRVCIRVETGHLGWGLSTATCQMKRGTAPRSRSDQGVPPLSRAWRRRRGGMLD